MCYKEEQFLVLAYYHSLIRVLHEFCLGLTAVHEIFFHLIFPCANIFFVSRKPPPPPSHKFSNGPSLREDSGANGLMDNLLLWQVLF